MSRQETSLIIGETTCHDFMDSLVQSLFGLSLRLESCIDLTEPPVREEIDASLHALHRVMARITEYRSMSCMKDHVHEIGRTP